MSDGLSFYVRGKVIKQTTEDGKFRLTPDLRIDDVIVVDLYTRHRLEPVLSSNVVVDFIQCMETGGWLPTECLQLLP